ncbi:hypothetical protein TNCV_179921 [Trichonephila clavipes]|nr:hypothetical protein TNCV_179921 [Trichonephila clavipes]
MCQIEIHEIYYGKGLDCTPIVSRNFEHRAGDSTFWLVPTPSLRENTFGGVSGLPTLLTNLTRGLAVRRLFRVRPCREGTIRLQTYMPSPGFKSRSYGTAVSVANHYTGWAAFV